MRILTLLGELDRLAAVPLLWLIRFYQLVLSPWIGQQCRFHPTCSVYAADALSKHGACKGLFYIVWRLLRCHPWSAGGFDPVPTAGTTGDIKRKEGCD